MATLAYTGVSTDEQMINWVNGLGISFLSAGYSSDATPVPQISIDNHLFAKNFIMDNNFYVYYDDTRLDAIGRSYGGIKTLFVIYDEDYLYLMIIGYWNNVPSIRAVFYYRKTDNYAWHGYGRAGYDIPESYAYIENINITDVPNGDTYLFKTVFGSYTVPADHIDITTKRLFKNGIVSDITFNGILDCTTISPFSMITIGGKNYYAIGTNTLIEVTS